MFISNFLKCSFKNAIRLGFFSQQNKKKEKKRKNLLFVLNLSNNIKQ